MDRGPPGRVKRGEDECPITSQRDRVTWVYLVLCFHLISYCLWFILRRINGLKLQIAAFSSNISSEATCFGELKFPQCCKLVTHGCYKDLLMVAVFIERNRDLNHPSK